MPDDRRGSLDGSAVDRVLEGRDSLSGRLGSLPDGHPSSAFEEDGSRREPTVSLRDLELDVAESPADHRRPLTDAEWSDHVRDVRVSLEKAHTDGLATDRRYAIDEDGEAWLPSRREVHEMLIDDLYAEAAAVPCEHKAIVAGGLAGAGKTTVLTEQAGIDRSQYLTINPDDVKSEMARRGLIPSINGLSPMEASDLVHEESSHIAKQVAIRARADGKNLIWDITMSSRSSTERRIDDLRASGYAAIEGIFVDIPVDVSINRADARHREDHEKHRAGDGLGGR
ncbi:MAG TPA: zeta toxin family protein, partial [Streptosporangiaceae bacterium]|nr:zeta toxin family protein [Streptosporangiaceae bacterium]